jgi:uncharacterized membrane protein YeiH
MRATVIFSIIDFLGVITGALGGALAARRNERHHYDIVGVVGLALASALGGGITRDVLIQRGPPLVLVDARYLYCALGGAVAGLLFGSKAVTRTHHFTNLIDAAAVVLFAVAGATRALDSGLSVPPALLLGVITAVGGGSLRDVLSGRTPKIFERGELYAIVAALAASVFMLCNYAGLPRTIATALGVGVGFVLRLLVLRFGWQTKAIR